MVRKKDVLVRVTEEVGMGVNQLKLTCTTPSTSSQSMPSPLCKRALLDARHKLVCLVSV